MMQTIVSMGIVNQMSRFGQHVTNNPLARAIRKSMEMVLEMLIYISTVRTGDLKLHLDTTEVFLKYFFTPMYLGDIKALAQTDTEV